MSPRCRRVGDIEGGRETESTSSEALLAGAVCHVYRLQVSIETWSGSEKSEELSGRDVTFVRESYMLCDPSSLMEGGAGCSGG